MRNHSSLKSIPIRLVKIFGGKYTRQNFWSKYNFSRWENFKSVKHKDTNLTVTNRSFLLNYFFSFELKSHQSQKLLLLKCVSTSSGHNPSFYTIVAKNGTNFRAASPTVPGNYVHIFFLAQKRSRVNSCVRVLGPWSSFKNSF